MEIYFLSKKVLTAIFCGQDLILQFSVCDRYRINLVATLYNQACNSRGVAYVAGQHQEFNLISVALQYHQLIRKFAIAYLRFDCC